ncbi:hypothetical protein BT63DRAFT_259094 [Microthyrium microscopicum]|uniref:Uncharacterized protein n=1 Tax=Microthyrium microscopicum TaxID=703497 RepID=A0A6A6UCH7_9PEZI|nr:hypothetical protein BT63DRAFT_259094 [Microthyrium microscopicum]
MFISIGPILPLPTKENAPPTKMEPANKYRLPSYTHFESPIEKLFGDQAITELGASVPANCSQQDTARCKSESDCKVVYILKVRLENHLAIKQHLDWEPVLPARENACSIFHQKPLAINEVLDLLQISIRSFFISDRLHLVRNTKSVIYPRVR